MEDKLYPKGYSVFFFMNNMDIHRYIDFLNYNSSIVLTNNDSCRIERPKTYMINKLLPYDNNTGSQRT
jgi:hypothetical protein